MPSERFWMVYGEGQRAPTYKHSSLFSAQEEARRLARANPGIAFYVLVATGGFQKSDLQEIAFDDDDGIPF